MELMASLRFGPRLLWKKRPILILIVCCTTKNGSTVSIFQSLPTKKQILLKKRPIELGVIYSSISLALGRYKMHLTLIFKCSFDDYDGDDDSFDDNDVELVTRKTFS